MSIDNFKICPICGTTLEREIKCDTDYIYYVTCTTCGRFALEEDYYESLIDRNDAKIRKSEIASYLFYHKDHLPFSFICGDTDFVPKSHRPVSIEEIKSWYPKTFSEKIDMFLLGLAKRMNFFGEPILFSYEQFYSASFVERNPQGPWRMHSDIIKTQAEFFENYLKNQGYTDTYKNGFIIQPKGLERIDSLQQKERNTGKNVFVSMSFSDNTRQTREALRDAIIDAKFSPEFIDEIIHNKQIVPEMFRLIRESRFLILEISDPNYGAYYEAGYALGLGKEVIICCNKEVFNRKYETEEEQKYAKYLRPHFDIAQKQILVWDDYDDLRKKLTEWIKELFS